MPTMNDIAKRAGVSPSTVSYAISGKRPVSYATKQRIYQAMNELGYQPDTPMPFAAIQHTKILALHYPLWRPTAGPRAEFLTSIAQKVTESGYGFLLLTSHEGKEVPELFRQGLIGGVIAMEVALRDPRIDLFKQQAVPFVMIGSCENNAGIDYVDLDADHALKVSIDYLVTCGHTHIALINQSMRLFERGTGYLTRSYTAFYREIFRRNLHGSDSCCEEDEQSGYATTMALLERDPEITAFILMTSSPSNGILRALADKGLRVPDNVSLIGIFSPNPLAPATTALTTVDFPFVEMGHMGAQMLINKVDGRENEPAQVLLKTSLTIRSSSGPLKLPSF